MLLEEQEESALMGDVPIVALQIVQPVPVNKVVDNTDCGLVQLGLTAANGGHPVIANVMLEEEIIAHYM